MAKKNADLPKLKEQIKNDKLKNIYLFYGDEEFLKNKYVNDIKNAIPHNGFEDFNHIIFNDTKNCES